ncbi:MAG: DUF3810 domain-containing protein [Planctomycetota bacterium]
MTQSRHPWRFRLATVVIAALAFGVQQLCAIAPAFTERWYSQGVYPLLARGLHLLTAWSPVALGEVGLLALIGWTLVRFLRGIRRAWRREIRWVDAGLRGFTWSASVLSIGFTLFILLWGINHSREPFGKRIGIDRAETSTAALARTAEKLALRATSTRPAGMQSIYDELDGRWRTGVAIAYAAAGRELPVLAGPPPMLRFPWISRILTLTSTAGIYSPFTGESNVNADMPVIWMAFSALHESAHFRGYAREDDANFIAWWVGSKSDDPLLRYAVEFMAWRYAMAPLKRADYGEWKRVRGLVSPEVLADERAEREFWDRQPKRLHETLTTIANITNDAYLRSAGHGDGIASYGRVVDWLVAVLER